MSNSVIKRQGKFWMGYLKIMFEGDVYKGYTWNSAKEVKRLSDVKEATEYKTLAKWLKEKGLKPELKDEILKATGSDSIYMLDRPVDPSVKEFEDYWWSDINEVCEQCIKACKQSSKVVVVRCSEKQLKDDGKD